MKAEGAEQSGSQSYVPQVEKDDRALKEALDLLRITVTDAAFPFTRRLLFPKERGNCTMRKPQSGGGFPFHSGFNDRRPC